ncbi:MAG: hypothetical protein M0P95_17945 [Sulfuritalea sp.]|jgi:hypothetical protein|nr:hypothetical protein [Sulfuritalea sp.]
MNIDKGVVPITARIVNAVEHNGRVFGEIHGDIRRRWADGHMISTSTVAMIDRSPERGGTGDAIVHTQNSVYDVTWWRGTGCDRGETGQQIG